MTVFAEKALHAVTLGVTDRTGTGPQAFSPGTSRLSGQTQPHLLASGAAAYISFLMNIMDSDRAFRAAARGNSAAGEASAAVNLAVPPKVEPGATPLIKRIERGPGGAFIQFFMTDDEIRTMNAGKKFAASAPAPENALLPRHSDARPAVVGHPQFTANMRRTIAEGDRSEISALAQALRKAQIDGGHGGEIGRIGPNVLLLEAAKNGNITALKMLRDLSLADYNARQLPIPEAFYHSLPHMTHYLKTQPQRRVKPLFNPRVADAAGLTARDHAALSGSREAVRYLEEWAPPEKPQGGQSFAQLSADKSLLEIQEGAVSLLPSLAPQANSMPSPFDRPPSSLSTAPVKADKPNHSF